MTKHVFCRDKIMFVATNTSYPNICRDKYFVTRKKKEKKKKEKKKKKKKKRERKKKERKRRVKHNFVATGILYRDKRRVW